MVDFALGGISRGAARERGLNLQERQVDQGDRRLDLETMVAISARKESGQKLIFDRLSLIAEEAKALEAQGLEDIRTPGASPEDKAKIRERVAQGLEMLDNQAKQITTGLSAAGVSLPTPVGRANTFRERALQLEPTEERQARAATEAGRAVGAEKLATASAILDAPPTQAQREQIAGVAQAEPDPFTTIGKARADLRRGNITHGEFESIVLSEQGGGLEARKETFANANALRDEFTKQSGSFVDANEAWNRVLASAEDPSPAGDLALIINYMKVLDPGSVVRESEFRTAAETGSFPQQLQAGALRVLNGQRLTPEQQADFVERSRKLITKQAVLHAKRVEEYTRLADEFGVDPSQVIIDMQAGLPNSAGATLSPSEEEENDPDIAARVSQIPQLGDDELNRQAALMADALAKNPSAFSQAEIDAMGVEWNDRFGGAQLPRQQPGVF